MYRTKRIRMPPPPVDREAVCCQSVEAFHRHLQVLTERMPHSEALLLQLHAEGALLVCQLLERGNMDSAKLVYDSVSLSAVRNCYPEVFGEMVERFGKLEAIEPLDWLLRDVCSVGSSRNGFHDDSALVGFDGDVLARLPHDRHFYVLEVLDQHVTHEEDRDELREQLAMSMLSSRDFQRWLLGTDAQRALTLRVCSIFSSRQKFLYKMVVAGERDPLFMKNSWFLKRIYEMLPSQPNWNSWWHYTTYERRYLDLRLYFACTRASKHFGFPDSLWNVIFKMTRRVGSSPFLSNFR